MYTSFDYEYLKGRHNGVVGKCKKSFEERFWSYVVKGNSDGDCWSWRVKTLPNGYAHFRTAKTVNGKQKVVVDYAHRISFVLAKGPIGKGMVIDHLCRNKECCNPDHLEQVTQKINMLRGETVQALNVAKAACPKGHPYDAENTYVDRAGKRHCRICRKARMSEFFIANPGYKKRWRAQRRSA